MKTKQHVSWIVVILASALVVSLGLIAVLATKYHSQNHRYQVLVKDLQQAHDELAGQK